MIKRGFGTIASRSTVTLSGAIHAASEALLKKVLAIAANILECSPDDLELRNGAVGLLGVPGKEITLANIAKAARPGWDNSRPAGMSAGLEETAYFEPPTVTWAYATHAAIVEIDAALGRLEAVPFDGRKLGALFDLIREPIPEFTILGGMMVNQEDVLNLLAANRSLRALTHSLKILTRHAVDRLSYRRGTRLMMGNALIARFLISLRDRDVPVLLNTSVKQIHSDADGPCAVTLEQDGITHRIDFRGGMIAATGGFNRNPGLRKRMLREPVAKFCPGAPGHTGSLHEQLFDIGAHYGEDDRDSAFWSPVSARARADGTKAVFPHFIFDRGRPGIITVNQSGRRFVNESLSYHPFTQGLFAAHATSPSIPAYLIADEAALRKYGLGMVRPSRWGRGAFLKDGYLTRGKSLPELANKLGIDPDNLVATVERFNGFARDGVDSDFGRGSTEYQRITAGDLSHGPNPCLGVLETPPFYAVRLFPGDIGAATGFTTNEHAQVLRKDGTSIARLYACGNDMHSVMGGNYPGPGITLGPAIVFGYVAARDIARRLL